MTLTTRMSTRSGDETVATKRGMGSAMPFAGTALPNC